MLPSFRTLFGPDVLPKSTIPPSFPRHLALRPNDSPVPPSRLSPTSSAPVDASWYREQQPSDVGDSASSHSLTNHVHDGWTPLKTHQSPTAQPTQPPLPKSSTSPHAPNDHVERSSSPSPSRSQSHTTSHPDARDRDSNYPIRFSSYGQGHHGPVDSMHYRSSTLDSTVSSVSSPPHLAAGGSEVTPLAMEAMAAMTISQTRPSQAATSMDSADSRIDTRHHRETAAVETFHAQPYHRPPSAHGHSYPGDARTGALDEGAHHHRPGHYQAQAYSQSHPSLHDQTHHQRMHDPVRVLDHRTHSSSSLPTTTSPPSSRPAHPSYPPSSPASHVATPSSPLSPSGMAWASTTHKNGLEAPSLQHGPPQQAVSPRLSKNHEGLVHRSNHSSHGHHPDRYATGSPSLRGINGTNHSHSGQHLRQASAGNPIGHPSRSVSDHIVSPTASYAYPHSPVHGSIRRPHSARPMGESHSFASSAQEIGSHMASLPHAAGSQDYPIGHATRPSPYPPRRRTESVPSSPQFSHTRPDRSWAESYRHDVYAEKFPRHQRSNTTHGHVGDGMYESFSKVLSTTPSSELRDRPSFQPSANLAATPPLPPPAYDPRKAGDDPVAGHSAIRPSASEPDLERVHGGRPAVQTNGQADYWTKPSFDMHERMHSDRLPDPKGLAMPLRKDATHSRTQEDHLEQDEADGSVEGEGEEEGEDEEEGLDDDDGEDDDSVDRVPQQARHSWALQDYDDTQARMHHPLNHEAYRYGDDPYGNPQAHSLYGDNQHSSDVDGQSSGSHPPLYAPHPYQPLQQYLLRPQRISKSPKEKPLQPKNSQRGPYLTRQRVLASGMEPGKGTACRYVCSYCQKRFSRPSSLRIHTYSHTGERPFKCTEKGCERQFSVQSNMRRHLRVHRMDKIKFLDPIYPSQIASERPLQSRPQQQQQQPPLSQSQPPQPPHTSPVDHRMAPPLPLIGTTPIRS